MSLEQQLNRLNDISDKLSDKILGENLKFALITNRKLNVYLFGNLKLNQNLGFIIY